MTERERKKKQPACSSCGSSDTVPIAYGFPGSEMFGAAERGEIDLGGCVIFDDNPTHRCRACNKRFGRS
ncbi:MAG: hypothetical protein ABIP03_13050 [Aquihabitans sp.]